VNVYGIIKLRTVSDKPSKTEADTEKGNNFTIGLGYKIGNVDLDWQLAKELVIKWSVFYFAGGFGSYFGKTSKQHYHFESGSPSAPVTRAKK